MKICVISVYFGRLPLYINLWLKSCSYNKTVNFMLVTDQKLASVPSNVFIVNSDLKSFKNLAEKKIGCSIRLETPYKCCDYKPMYGLILEDYLLDYDFWGHCDIDLIFGDIRKFVTEQVLSDYRKIYHLGHLSIYRNDAQTKMAFKLSGSLRCSWLDVIHTDKICVFDEEYGIDRIFKKNGLPIYDSYDFVDIDPNIDRMCCIMQPNYRYQIFTFEEGHCYRYYSNGTDVVHREEFVYIHMQRRTFYKSIDESKRYVITSHGFERLPEEITNATIKSLNPYRNWLFEKIEHEYKKYTYLIRRKIRGTHL